MQSRAVRVFKLAAVGLLLPMIWSSFAGAADSAPAGSESECGTAAEVGPAEPVAVAEVATGPKASASRAHIDPETGKLVPPPAHRAPGPLASDPELGEAFSTSSAGLYEVVNPDGSVTVRLQGRFQSGVFARIGPDGKLIVAHTPAILERAPAAPPADRVAAAGEGEADHDEQ